MKTKSKALIVVSILTAILCWYGLTIKRTPLDQGSSSQKQAKANDELIDAINRGDVRRVQILLDSGVSPNTHGVIIEGAGSLSALLIASEKADNGIVELLIKKGADVNTPDSRGFTPLMTSSAVGHIHAVKALVSTGADVNAKRSNKETALAIAREADQKEVVAFLEKSGAK